jgi:hypothetical protein
LHPVADANLVKVHDFGATADHFPATIRYGDRHGAVGGINGYDSSAQFGGFHDDTSGHTFLVSRGPGCFPERFVGVAGGGAGDQRKRSDGAQY